MTRTTTLTLAAVLCSTAAAAQTAQNPITFSTQGPGTPRPAPNTNPDAPLPPGTSTLTGHVFAADSGQPLRKAQVRIFAPEIRENRMATTDAEGRYEFKEVRGGRYTISASKGSYVGLSYGQARSTDAPKPLQILDNQNVERVDVSLPPGGIITGRIVDEYGEPMSDVQVGPQSYQSIQGQRRLVPSGRQASTNDIGEFRLFGIAPGQYLPERDVAADQRDEQRRADRICADVLPGNRQRGAGAAPHRHRRSADQRRGDGAEADAGDTDQRHRDDLGGQADDRRHHGDVVGRLRLLDGGERTDSPRRDVQRHGSGAG